MALASSAAATSRTTAVGAGAILLWASLALLTTWTGTLPPFQTMALCFAVAFVLSLGKWLARREDIASHLRQPASVWLTGVGGLFGYHFLYFVALKTAPAVEANLINYLWPLLLVLFSALLPGERLRWWHLAGTALGLCGTLVLVTGGGSVSFRPEYTVGYASAFGCAICWAAYSVLSRRFGSVPTDAVGGFCGVTAVLAVPCHLAFERTVSPSPGEWLALLVMGAGPMGIAFFFWDVGMKRGNIKALGGLSYATPLLSTLLLILAGRARLNVGIALACLFIVGGAVLASRDLWARGSGSVSTPPPPRDG
ncbi:DMT family transporter [Hyalangium rubrum]|uniref:EamA family transporter n=1 Tax=Hyalangium rubrum TaxID=3103134 RepID=A0ABU5HD91_9BACT|nr:EamA family transporter [Hyalangium sp. s54d21]MDY7231423.1 EamA family transporter [Hyalangium sp. s54d21]